MKVQQQVYLDDILATMKASYEDHLQVLDEIFIKLVQDEMQFNFTKSKLCAIKLEILEFWLTTKGYHPLKKWVEEIMNIEYPNNVEEVRQFVGIVNFIKNNIPQRAKTLDPITKITSKSILVIWFATEEYSFIKVKQDISEAVMLAYPDPKKYFEI